MSFGARAETTTNSMPIFDSGQRTNGLRTRIHRSNLMSMDMEGKEV